MNDGNKPEMGDEDRQSAKVEEKQTAESSVEKRTSKAVLEVKISTTSTGKRKSGTDDRKERKSGSVVKEKISAEQLPKPKSNASIEQTKSAAVVEDKKTSKDIEKRKSVGIEKHASDTGTGKRISTAVTEKKISDTDTLKTYPDPDLNVEDKPKLAVIEKSKSIVGDIKHSSIKISEIQRLKSGEYEKEGDKRSKPTLEFRASALEIEKDNRHASMDGQEEPETESDSIYVPSIDFDTDPRVQWIKKSILNYMGMEDEELFYNMLEEKGAKQNLEDLLTATIPPTETSAKNRVMYVSKIIIEEHIEVEEEVVEWRIIPPPPPSPKKKKRKGKGKGKGRKGSPNKGSPKKTSKKGAGGGKGKKKGKGKPVSETETDVTTGDETDAAATDATTDGEDGDGMNGRLV